jgi:ubiquitin-protein ligase
MSREVRLKSEIREMEMDAPANCSAGPIGDDIGIWAAHICGPTGTPYEGGFFKLMIRFPASYPFVPPSVRFITRIYHCNISASGDICLDVLKENWSPALTISKILLSVCSLLSEPNPSDPLVPDIAEQLRSDRPGHDAVARQYTHTFAS